MGVEMKPVTVKLGEAEHQKLERIEQAFSPFIKGRSATIRFSIEVVYGMAFASWTLLGALGRLQGLLRPTSYIESVPNDTVLQLELEFPVRLGQEQPVGQLKSPLQLHRFQLISPHSRADRPSVLEMAANRPPSSLAKISAYFEERLA